MEDITYLKQTFQRKVTSSSSLSWNVSYMALASGNQYILALVDH